HSRLERDVRGDTDRAGAAARGRQEEVGIAGAAEAAAGQSDAPRRDQWGTIRPGRRRAVDVDVCEPLGVGGGVEVVEIAVRARLIAVVQEGLDAQPVA